MLGAAAIMVVGSALFVGFGYWLMWGARGFGWSTTKAFALTVGTTYAALLILLYTKHVEQGMPLVPSIALLHIVYGSIATGAWLEKFLAKP